MSFRGVSTAVAVGVALVAIGCGSNNDNSSTSGSTSTAASGGGTTTQAAASTSNVDCSTVRQPTTLSWNGPKDAVAPPAGKGLVVLIPTSLQAEAAVRPIKGMQEALKALGYKSQVLDGKGTPSVYTKNINQAISLHAKAIITAGISPAIIKNAIAQARSKGIIMISNAETGDPNVAAEAPSSGYYADVSPDETAMGKLIGDEIICSTDQKAHLLAFNDAEYSSVDKFIKAAVAEVKTCSTCKVEDPIATNVTQLQDEIPSETVNKIKTNPDINAVLSGYDPVAVFQIPALKSTRLLDKVKLYSEYGDLQNLDFIRNGQQEATVAVPYEWSGWASVDEMLRAMAKKPLVDENIPFALITKDANLPPKGQAFTGGVDYAGEYGKLWGLGG